MAISKKFPDYPAEHYRLDVQVIIVCKCFKSREWKWLHFGFIFCEGNNCF